MSWFEEAKKLRQEGMTYDHREVVERDLQDIKNSSIVLVDFRKNVNVIGSAMEMAYAKMWGKKIYVFGEAYRQHYWVKYHADRFFTNLDEAIEGVMELNNKIGRFGGCKN